MLLVVHECTCWKYCRGTEPVQSVTKVKCEDCRFEIGDGVLLAALKSQAAISGLMRRMLINAGPMSYNDLDDRDR